jgi:hypothetical protein
MPEFIPATLCLFHPSGSGLSCVFLFVVAAFAHYTFQILRPLLPLLSRNLSRLTRLLDPHPHVPRALQSRTRPPTTRPAMPFPPHSRLLSTRPASTMPMPAMAAWSLVDSRAPTLRPQSLTPLGAILLLVSCHILQLQCRLPPWMVMGDRCWYRRLSTAIRLLRPTITDRRPLTASKAPILRHRRRSPASANIP